MEFQLFVTTCEDPEIRSWAKRQVLEDHRQQDSISERPKSRERGQKLIDFLFYNGHVFLYVVDNCVKPDLMVKVYRAPSGAPGLQDGQSNYTAVHRDV